MTADELQGTFATLADRFRDELARELRAKVADLVAKSDAERVAAVEEAAARVRQETEARAQAQLQAALSEADAKSRAAADEALARASAERAVAIEEAAARAHVEAEEKAAARLETAVQEAEARGRAAVQLVRPEGWRSRLATEDTVPVPAGAWQDDARSADNASNLRLLEAVRGLDRAASLTEILVALTDAAEREAARVGLLLPSGSELRGWRFVGFGSLCEPASSVVVLPEGAGILADAVRTGGLVSANRTTPGESPWFAKGTNAGARVAVPIVLDREVVAVLYADDGEQDKPGPRLAPASADTLELLARHAARCLEAVTALKVFGLVASRPEAAQPRASRTGPDQARAASSDTEEAAKRYARLLVSEIKLYHETAVVTGRRERDLVARLGGEIARARALYEQRVSRETRGQIDYFHDELVRTLADGDASLLGHTTQT